MSNLNGGYIMVDAANTNLATVKGLLNAQKPVLVYGLGAIPLYATSVVKTNDAVVINTSKGLVTITSDGVTTKVTDITKLTTPQCNALNCGDVVLKDTEGQLHAYKVSYKQDRTGMCLTYVDATTVETVSYDYTDGAWVYNSTDKTTLTPDA